MNTQSVLQKPRTLRVAWAVGRVTFREVLRDKILYNIFLVCLLLLGVGVLASKLTFIRPERVVLDFGLSGLNLSCSLIAILMGSTLIGREFEQRTIYVALCHPISKAQFVLGKYLGIVGVLMVNWGLLSTAYLIILISASAGLKAFSPSLFVALFLILLQSGLLASLSILFSSFSTTSLSVIYSIGFYLIGNNISQLRLVAARTSTAFGGQLLNFITILLPNLEYFNLGKQVTYGLPIAWNVLGLSLLYGLFMITLLLLLAGLLIQAREI